MQAEKTADRHEHNFENIAIHRIKRVQPNYAGTPGDKAFLTHVCDCGKNKAFDYGTTAEMQSKFNQYNELELP